jgi:hypothetical protein
MKRLLLTSAALVVLVTPALAATSQKHPRHHASSAATRAYASDPVRVRRPAPPALDPYVVIENGQYVGRDPDPFIRLQLYRDPNLPAY